MWAVASGMDILSVDNLSPLDLLEAEGTNPMLILSFDLGGETIAADPDPIGLFRLNLLVTQSSGELTIDLSDFTAIDQFGNPLSFGQSSYTLTIPAPATLALLVGGFGSLRRRRSA